MPSFPDRRSTRRGYTLLELLIVVAVVLVVASLTLPALNRPFAKSKLRDSAKQLRVALSRARLEAIGSGAPQQFRYQPGAGVYEITARSTAEGGGFLPVALEGGVEEAPVAEDSTYPAAARYELPEGVRFFDPSASEIPPDEPDSIPSESDESWSAPIVFYPNGRTFNARLRLYGEYDYYVDVTLRGLTGASRIGEIQRLEPSAEESFESPVEESL
ncbi:MAG TPA: prepilin-type N-terminal cleavage/methylation domain-containing protein [Thermoguttaceae bacterium]|nr:prepilin-type N-terminal cleavage/methylation domain-containing protein [Thermoguttaceae bacterium]